MPRIPNNIIIVVLIVIILFSTYSITNSINPSAHWLNLLTLSNTYVNVTAIDYYSGYVYATIYTGDGTVKMVELSAETGNLVVLNDNGGNIVSYSSQDIGEPTSIDVASSEIFIGTSTGHIIVIDPNTLNINYLHVLYAGSNPISIKYLYYEGSNIHIAGYCGGLIYYIWMDTSGSSLNAYSISGSDVFWAYKDDVNNKLYLYYRNSTSENPMFAIISLTDMEGTAFDLNPYGYTVADYNPVPSINLTENHVIIPVVLENSQTGEIYTFIYDIGLDGTINYVRKMSITGGAIAVTRIIEVEDGSIYYYGTINNGSASSPNLVFGIYMPNNATLKAWTIGGNDKDFATNGALFTYGDKYFFAGALTRSYGDTSSHGSSFITLLSGALTPNDIYSWQADQPSYRNTEDGVYIRAAEINNTSIDVSIQSSQVSIDSADIQIYQVLNPESPSYETISSYIALTEYAPTPVPELNSLILVGVVAVLSVIGYVLYRRNR